MIQNQIITLSILLVLSALFSGIETALMSVSNIKVKALVKQKKKGSCVLQKLKQNPHKLIITILIGNNIVNIAASAIATVMFTEIFGSSGVGIATGAMTFLILVFGEITPKTFAAGNAVRISLTVARPIQILSIILAPLVWIFEKISKFMSRILGSKTETKLSGAELETIVTMGKKEGLLDKEAAEIMHNVLKLEGTTAEEIMTPRINMTMLDGNKKINEVLDFIVKTPYSRYPVYTEKESKIDGIIDIDDVLRLVRDKKLSRKVKSILRPVLFVPETKEVDDLLTELEGKEVPMAIVVDEYEDVEGLVTVEDILEEIVGDIFDKSKIKGLDSKKLKRDIITIDAKTPIDDLNKVLNLGIKNDHFNTIGGFIQDELQRIPNAGEQIKLRNAVLEISQVTKQGIKKVKIIKKS